MPKLSVPIEPDLFYTVQAFQLGGGRFAMARGIKGRDVPSVKRDFRNQAPDGERLRYEVTPEGTAARNLPHLAEPSKGMFLPDSAGVDRYYKKAGPSESQSYLARLRLDRALAQRHAEYFELQAAELGDKPSQSKKLDRLLTQAKGWRARAAELASLIATSENAGRAK